MLGRFGPALALICLLASGAARAGPLTFYANPPDPTAASDWLAAISGSTIWSPYPYDVQIIRHLITVGLNPDGSCCIVSNPVTTKSLGSFEFLMAEFSSITIDGGPVTVTTDVSIIFPTPIYGFASLSPGGVFEVGGLDINGQTAPFTENSAFLGAVGYTNVLSFQCDCRYTTDETDYINFSDIIVATKVNEPSGAALLAIALCLMTLVGLGLSPDGRVKLPGRGTGAA